MQPAPWHAHYDPGVPISIDYEPLSIPALLERSVGRFPDRPALIFLNRRMTYAQLAHDVRRCAAGLARLGVRQGTRVAIQMPNIPQAVVSFYAALSLGAEVVMTNPLYTFREVEHQWRDAGCTLALTTDFIWDQVLRERRAELAPKQFVVASIPEYLRFPLNLLAPLKLRRQSPPKWARFHEEPGAVGFRSLMERGGEASPSADVDWERVAVLQYTGGTTGPSKGAMLTHKNLSTNAQAVKAWFTGVHEGHEVMLTALPLFHVFGLSICMNWGIMTGSCLVLVPNPRDLGSVVQAVTKHKVTLFPAVPALFNGLNNYPGIEHMDVRSVKSCFSGSAPIPDDVLQRFEALTGAHIVEGFGMSETSPVTHCNPLLGQRKSGSVGVPFPDTEARIVDPEDDTRDLPVGQEGELLVRGPQVMLGYWQRPEETEQTLRGGWMHTGDLAVMDADGYFRIVGRKKDMINCSGMKVFPDEVDNVLMAHPKVLEAATIGVPDERRGETVKSFLVLQPGTTMSVDEVQAYARENLAGYKIPREVEFLDELPKSSVLKVLRRELREREIQRRGQQG